MSRGERTLLNSLRRRLQPMGRPFRLLIVSDALILLSLMVGQVAVPWWLVHEGGAHDLALWAGALALGSLLALPLMSPLGDRVSKRTLISAGVALSLAKGLALAALVQAGRYHIGMVIALELVGVVAMAALMPAILVSRHGSAVSLALRCVKQGSRTAGGLRALRLRSWPAAEPEPEGGHRLMQARSGCRRANSTAT